MTQLTQKIKSLEETFKQNLYTEIKQFFIDNNQAFLDYGVKSFDFSYSDDQDKFYIDEHQNIHFSKNKSTKELDSNYSKIMQEAIFALDFMTKSLHLDSDDSIVFTKQSVEFNFRFLEQATTKNKLKI